MFRRNESMVDRIVRAIAGVVLLWIGLWPLGGLAGAAWGVVVTLVGAVLVVTAITGFCLIYKLLGVSTVKE